MDLEARGCSANSDTKISKLHLAMCRASVPVLQDMGLGIHCCSVELLQLLIPDCLSLSLGCGAAATLSKPHHTLYGVQVSGKRRMEDTERMQGIKFTKGQGR